MVDVVNAIADKKALFTFLKTYLTGKNAPAFPKDSAEVQDKLNYLFTLTPEYFIGAISAYEIKNAADTKKRIEDEMKLVQDDSKQGLDMNIYGNGKEFTEEGMIQYYSEKRGGIYHSFAKVGAPKQHQEES
jgi:hypothetical protein